MQEILIGVLRSVLTRKFIKAFVIKVVKSIKESKNKDDDEFLAIVKEVLLEDVS